MDFHEDAWERYKAYHNRRATLVEYNFRTLTRLNKSLLTISSGALVLSVTMYREIFAAAKDIVFFSLSLAGWGATIGLVLLANWLDTFAFRAQIKIEDEYFVNSQKKIKEERPPIRTNPWSKWILFALNPLVAICFCAGLLFLTLFFFSNFPNNIPVKGSW